MEVERSSTGIRTSGNHHHHQRPVAKQVVSRVNGYVKNYNRVIGKRKSYGQRRKVHQVGPNKINNKVPMALQQLFLSCREVFRGPGTVPFPQDVQKLCRILDEMKAEDFGLSSDLQFFNPNNVVKGTPPRVTYTTIYKCTNFSLCIFFLPAKGVIPLHNHPEMTVFSKLLLGEMHIKSYDWVNDHDQPPSSDHHRLGLAKLKADSVFTAASNTSVLYPRTGGNIHAFTAVSPCAVLDVMGPPYSKDDGRDCSYYKDHPYNSSIISNRDEESYKLEEGESYGWLEEIEMPEDSHMDGIEYLGPQIQDKLFA